MPKKTDAEKIITKIDRELRRDFNNYKLEYLHQLDGSSHLAGWYEAKMQTLYWTLQLIQGDLAAKRLGLPQLLEVLAAKYGTDKE